MARLQSGAVPSNRQWQPIEEVVGSALQSVGGALANDTVSIQLLRDLPLIEFNAVLIEHAFANLRENAAEYTPPSSVVTISARMASPDLQIAVADSGAGLQQSREKALFEKSTRAEKASVVSGVGLGLAICRAIAEAHEGRLWVESVAVQRPEKGAGYPDTLPLGPTPSMPMPEESEGATFATAA